MKNILKTGLLILIIGFFGCSNDELSEANTVPEDVVLISPLKNQVCELGVKYERNTSRLLFEWERAKNAQVYDLIVTNLETGENYITYTDIFENYKEIVLDNDIAYSWQVIAKNINTTKTGESEVWKFYFVGEPRSNYLPFPANIISPNSSEIVSAIDGKVRLSWQGSDPDFDNLTYTVFIDTVDGKQPTIDPLKNLTNSSVDVSVVSGTTYFWRVQSFDGFSSTFSQVYSFTVN